MMVRAAARRVIQALRDAEPAPRHRQCRHCRHFDDDREQVERELPGLLVLSSGFGDSWGDAGLCRKHQLMLVPFHTCDAFSARGASPEQDATGGY